jgi:uncharacterized phage infection (PIP) family protein YhgE
MVDREAVTLTPPPPADRDLDAEHKALTVQLADHPDPKVRILAHISTRQFDLSERLSAMQQEIKDGFASLKSTLDQTKRDLGDKIDKLDRDFVDVDERTTELERHSLNGGSAPADQQQ